MSSRAPSSGAAAAAGVPVVAAVLAFALFLLPGLRAPWGPFIDELYYVSCALRPAWGYVDHPPLAPLLLRASRALLGPDGLLALRLPVALAGALLVLGVGLLARRLGARRFGQAIACGAAMLAPYDLIAFGYYSMNAFELLAWLALGWIAIATLTGGRPRGWLAFGVVAGVALLFKHTTVVFLAAIGIGLLLTPARRALTRPWPWAGLAIAAALVAPNLAWQAAHGWPSLEFYRNADLYKNVATAPLQALALQVLVSGPGALPVWIAGLVLLLGRRRPERVDFLGWAALLLLVGMVLSGRSRPDRIGGLYPLLFAAGGAALDLATRGRPVALRALLVGWLVVFGAVTLPLGSPILSPAATAAYGARLHLVPQIEAGAGKRTALPQWFADRLGWPELVDSVESAERRLPPGERREVPVFVPSYGHAGAIEWLGRGREVGRPYSGHNTWWMWGPPPDPVSVAVVVGNDSLGLSRLFEHVERAGEYTAEGITPWRDHAPIWIVRGPRARIADEWPRLKHFE